MPKRRMCARGHWLAARQTAGCFQCDIEDERKWRERAAAEGHGHAERLAQLAKLPALPHSFWMISTMGERQFFTAGPPKPKGRRRRRA